MKQCVILQADERNLINPPPIFNATETATAFAVVVFVFDMNKNITEALAEVIFFPKAETATAFAVVVFVFVVYSFLDYCIK